MELNIENIETVEQAIDFIISKLTDEDKEYIKSHTPLNLHFGALHFGLGLFIRNKFFHNKLPKFREAYSNYKIHSLSIGEVGEGSLIDAVWRKLKGINVDDEVHQILKQIEELEEVYGEDIDKLNNDDVFLNLHAKKTSLLLGISYDKALAYCKLKIEEKIYRRQGYEEDTEENKLKRGEISTKIRYILALLTDEQIEYANHLKAKILEIKGKLNDSENNDILKAELKDWQDKLKELVLNKKKNR